MIATYTAQTIWRKPKTGVDANGQPVFGAAVQMTARWLEKRRLVRNAQGEQVISEVTVSLAGDAAVVAGDRLSADGTVYHDVIAFSVSRGLSGAPELKRAFI